MEVILLEDVRNLGDMGSIVDVANGYGRNYLIPQGLAEPATSAKKSRISHQVSMIDARREKERAEAREILGGIDGVSVSIPKRVAEDDELYGSVSARDLVDVLAQQDIEINRKQVQIDGPFGELGIYKVPIKLASGIFAHIRLWVVAV
jgi:large subunit ribosomal protein L9